MNTSIGGSDEGQRGGISRRQFMAATTVSTILPTIANAESVDPPVPLSGIQISPFSIFDEGIDRCLDTLKEKAAINALFIYSQCYYPGYNKPSNVLATDHGVPIRNFSKSKLPSLWVRHDESVFADAVVGHQRVTSDFEYGDRDLFREIREPATQRGMKVYARILEADHRRGKLIPGYERVRTVDHKGQPGHGPCWNNPHYRRWVDTTIHQLVTHYELDGLQYGAERTGPLSHVLYRGMTPTCFCTHCVRRHERLGTNVGRAREGYGKLMSMIKDAESGKSRSVDGMLTNILRVFHRYPEVLVWDYEWFQADEEICRSVHQIAKSIRPSIDSGRHVDHQRSSWDIFFRSAMPYGEMAEQADFIKPILYHDAMGPRLRWWVLDRLKNRMLNELSLEQSLSLFYSLNDYDKAKMPSLDQLDRIEANGLGAEYVGRETRRCKESVGAKAKVYSGIGIDVPWYVPDGMEPRPSDADVLQSAVRAAFNSGADGVLASREYDEMWMSSLEAFGSAVREHARI